MSFDIVVSLGFRCYTALELRRMMIQTIGLPFDWIVADANGTAEAIINKFAGTMNPENFESHELYVLDKKYGFEYWHDFLNKADPLPELEAMKTKRARLEKRFFDLLASNLRILFVRQEVAHHGSIETLDLIGRAIATCRPADTFHILYLSNTMDTQEGSNFSTFTIPECESPSPEIWDQAFNKIHSKERINGYRPALVKASKHWPTPIRKQASKLIGTYRKRSLQASMALHFYKSTHYSEAMITPGSAPIAFNAASNVGSLKYTASRTSHRCRS